MEIKNPKVGMLVCGAPHSVYKYKITNKDMTLAIVTRVDEVPVSFNILLLRHNNEEIMRRYIYNDFHVCANQFCPVDINTTRTYGTLSETSPRITLSESEKHVLDILSKKCMDYKDKFNEPAIDMAHRCGLGWVLDREYMLYDLKEPLFTY